MPAHGREKRRRRCRSGRVGLVLEGGGRSGGVREPQLVLANDATMRRPAGAHRCHTYFSRNGRGRRGRTNRDAICSARQGVGARLRCHRCGSGATGPAGASQIKSSTESKFSKPRPRRPGSSAVAAALLTTFPPRVPSKLRRPSHEHHVHLSCESRNIVLRKTFEESCCKTESERCCKMQRQ